MRMTNDKFVSDVSMCNKKIALPPNFHKFVTGSSSWTFRFLEKMESTEIVYDVHGSLRHTVSE